MSSPKLYESEKRQNGHALGLRIARMRKSRGLSQLELARKIGLTTPGAVSNYEKGRIPRGDRLHDLAAALGVTVELLLTSIEMPKVSETPEAYLQLNRGDREIVKEVEKLLLEADEQTKKDLKYEIAKIKRLAMLPKKRA